MKAFKFLAILGLIFIISQLYAQNQVNPKKIVKHSGKTFMAGGIFDGGSISAKAFDSLLQLPLISMDTLEHPHQSNYFYLTYIERNIYEDSIGRPEILGDYFSVDCFDGKVPDAWLKSLHSRLKEGDTVLITNVQSYYNDSVKSVFYTQPMKIELTR